MSGVTLRPIPGFSLYRAGSDGRIWSLRRWQRMPHDPPWPMTGTLPHNFTPPRGPRGVRYESGRYLVVTLLGDDGEEHRRLRVHRLICLAFHGPPDEEAMLCRHLDDDKKNNVPGNLAWGWPKDNTADAIKNGRSISGQSNPMSRSSLERRQANA
jgi:hypothetical protein